MKVLNTKIPLKIWAKDIEEGALCFLVGSLINLFR